MSPLQERLSNTFIELIKIDEIYPHEKEISRYVTNHFNNLGIHTTSDAFGNIIAYLEGTGEPMILCTHLDIPEIVPNLAYAIEGDTIRATGKSILGADPKSGLAVLLELARHIKTNSIKTNPIEFVFTRGEEAGLLGAEHLDYSLLKSKTGLIIDEDGPCTNVVIQAPGYYLLDVTFIGKIVHPRDWREGVNALEIAAQAITQLKQGEIVPGVTFNIGMFSAGTARNTTPGTAELHAELRSFDTEEMIKQGENVEKICKDLEKKSKIKVEISRKVKADSYKLATSHPLFQQLEKTYDALHLKPNYYATTGRSDANIFNAQGITAVPIGSAYYLAHQYTEYVKLTDMEQLHNFLLHFVGGNP